MPEDSKVVLKMDERERNIALDTGMEAVKEDARDTRGIVSSLYEWMEAAIFSLVCVVLVFSFLFRIVGVDGDSMQTTLLDHDRLILTDLFYTPGHGDIVVINQHTQEPLIKRIIAMSGDRLDIDEETGEVILNGKVLDEPYVNGPFTERRQFTGEMVIPEGYVFVMGDNRGYSKDSRYTDIGENGLISTRDIMGKAVFRIWPFSQIGSLS